MWSESLLYNACSTRAPQTKCIINSQYTIPCDIEITSRNQTPILWYNHGNYNAIVDACDFSAFMDIILYAYKVA